MKKIWLLLPLLGVLAVGCENSDPAADRAKDEQSAEDAGGYLSLNVVAPRATGTRAGGYENATPTENQVERVRFFFFKKDGSPVQVKRDPDTNEYNTFCDWEPSEVDKPEEVNPGVETVEKIVHTTVVVNAPGGPKSPEVIMVVLNPSEEVLALKNPTMDELRDVIADFVTDRTDGNFVMTNAVYVEKNDEGEDVVIDYTVIRDEEKQINHLYYKLEEAEADPVTIYVERAVARLDLTIDATAAGVTAVADEEDTYDTGETFDETPVYVKLLGWTVTATPDASRLIKSVDPTWADDLFGLGTIEPWNAAIYHRSFWGINPPEDRYGYDFCSYNQIKGANGMAEKTVYLQENAAHMTTAATGEILPGYESKVIVAGQLVDGAGKALTIAEYGFHYYSLEGLLNYFANRLLNFYKLDGSTYKKIGPDDLTFMTQREYNTYMGVKPVAGVEVKGGYFVYVVPADQNATWYMGSGADAPAYTAKEAAEYIQNSLDNRVLLWDQGQTYYYFTIRHLGAEENPGYYGVVRNHIYSAKVVKLFGLGTPVYRPDEEIYPEDPYRDGNIMAAQIDVLQWRYVSQSYEFSW